MKTKTTYRKTVYLESIRILFIALWMYTVAVKFGNMSYTLDTMRKQIFPEQIAEILAYVVPIAALICTALLFYNIRIGLWTSAGLLFLFNTYITVFLSEIFRKKTCSCAGIFADLDYNIHLILNSIMIIIAFTGIYIYHKKINGEAENREKSRHNTFTYTYNER